MTTQVLEGTWEEISKHAKRLTGRQLRVTILDEEQVSKPNPNKGMLEALRKVRERNKTMRETSGIDTLKMIREARSGGMFGNGSDD